MAGRAGVEAQDWETYYDAEEKRTTHVGACAHVVNEEGTVEVS